ncbi:MAG: L-aspartate oxidase, partial [Candidatus Micrarchaeota archaeon]
MIRYLAGFDTRELEGERYDVAIVGGGLAGLSAALEASKQKDRSILVLEKSDDGSSLHAQGGIAVALGRNDSPELHLRDTLNAGAGLCDSDAARILVREGLARVKMLVDEGAPFDKNNGDLALGRESAHSRHRIIHASGDSTGEKITKFVRGLAEERAEFESAFVVDVLTKNEGCVGLLVERGGELGVVHSNSVVIASGGYAALYEKTTNPSVSVGDGSAAAHRAGCELCDLEFVQFHPTLLAGTDFLVSESVRGEGALLVNDLGKSFIRGDPGGLRTRDVVAVEIYKQLAAGRKVFLDARKLDAEFFSRRFQTIFRRCLEAKIDVSRDLIPVEPAAHYCMGGIKTSLNAETNIRGIFACGEAACTGAHGANRLASSSLLEALVFGARAGESAAKIKKTSREEISHETRETNKTKNGGENADVVGALKHLMWKDVGIIRNKASLERARDAIGRMRSERFDDMNAISLASLVVKPALLREESRG